MERYNNIFDMGIFTCIKDNEDGTAIFIKQPDPFDKPPMIKLEYRKTTYPWSQMRSKRCKNK